MTEATVAGVVLAGGRSRRFGRDKAVEPLGGRPLIAWCLEALGPPCAVWAINGPAALAATLGLPAIPDIEGAAAGPLAGVAAALSWAAGQGRRHVCTVPCDTPFLPRDLAARLAEAPDAAVRAARARRAHPLCALWDCGLARDLARMAAQETQPPLETLIADLGGAWVAFDDEGTFANVNTATDFAAAARRLEPHSSR